MPSEWIDVSSTKPRIAYTATAAQTAFLVPFVFFNNTDLDVYQNGALLELGTDYSVSGAEEEDGGAVTLATGANVGDAVLIVRRLPIVQTTHIPPSGPLDVPAINVQLSKLVAIGQQLDDDHARSVHLPENDPNTTGELAAVAVRQNKLLGFGSSGEIIYPLGPSYVGGTAIGVAQVDSLATAQVTTFDVSVNIVKTAGHAVPGDGGGATYERGTGTGSFTDGGGVSWIPVVDQSNAGAAVVSTRAIAATIAFSAAVTYLVTGGITTAGDGGGATYQRGSGSGSFTDAGGTSWVPITGASTSLGGFGAIGDGTTDNLTAINNAIAAAGWRGVLEIPVDSAGGVYHCSAEPSNPKGVYFRGPGYIQTPEAVTGYKRRWDLRGEQFPIVEGKEYLNILHEIFRAGNTSTTKIEFLGDSTTLGTGITDANYVISTLVQNNMLLYGFDCQFTNRAVGGTTSEDLRTSQIPASIAANPHLAIIRTGINDPYLRGSSPGTVHTEAQVEEVAELVRVSLDTALATYRASLAVTRTTLMLMTPNISTLTVNGRDERYLEAISPMYRELARKYQCVFVDTYRAWRFGRGLNAASAVGVPWLDTPYGANDGGIHPLESFNMQIADLITQIVLPETLRRTVRPSLGQLNTTLTYQNGWSNLAGQSFRARRRGQIVQLEGTIVPGTTTSGTTITTLPTTMRPARRRFFGCITNATSQVPALMYVDTDGTVRVQTWPSGATNVVMEAINYIVGD